MCLQKYRRSKTLRMLRRRAIQEPYPEATTTVSRRTPEDDGAADSGAGTAAGSQTTNNPEYDDSTRSFAGAASTLQNNQTTSLTRDTEDITAADTSTAEADPLETSSSIETASFEYHSIYGTFVTDLSASIASLDPSAESFPSQPVNSIAQTSLISDAKSSTHSSESTLSGAVGKSTGNTSAGVIVGVVVSICSVALAAVLLGLLFTWRRRCQQQQQSQINTASDGGSERARLTSLGPAQSPYAERPVSFLNDVRSVLGQSSTYIQQHPYATSNSLANQGEQMTQVQRQSDPFTDPQDDRANPASTFGPAAISELSLSTGVSSTVRSGEEPVDFGSLSSSSEYRRRGSRGSAGQTHEWW